MTTHTIELDKETKQLLAEVARCIRFVSHGERDPAGLEGLTMSIGGAGKPGDNNLVDAILDVASALREIADANQNIADAVEKLKT